MLGTTRTSLIFIKKVFSEKSWDFNPSYLDSDSECGENFIPECVGPQPEPQQLKPSCYHSHHLDDFPQDSAVSDMEDVRTDLDVTGSTHYKPNSEFPDFLVRNKWNCKGPVTKLRI